jgi:hypothetical protein
VEGDQVNPEPKLIEIGIRLFEATEKARMACIGLTALHVTPSSIPALLLIAARTPTRVAVAVRPSRKAKPKTLPAKTKPKTLPPKAGEPTMVADRIAAVMGDKPIAIPAILSELTSRGWLPKGANPRANVSVVLCQRQDLFQRTARGVYKRKKTIIVPRKPAQAAKPPTEPVKEPSHPANGAVASSPAP